MNFFYLLELFSYDSDCLFTDSSMGLFLFLRILWADTRNQEFLVSTAVSVIEYHYFLHPVLFDRKAKLIQKRGLPLPLMDDSQARAGQNQLIVFPA